MVRHAPGNQFCALRHVRHLKAALGGGLLVATITAAAVEPSPAVVGIVTEAHGSWIDHRDNSSVGVGSDVHADSVLANEPPNDDGWLKLNLLDGRVLERRCKLGGCRSPFRVEARPPDDSTLLEHLKRLLFPPKTQETDAVTLGQRVPEGAQSLMPDSGACQRSALIGSACGRRPRTDRDSDESESVRVLVGALESPGRVRWTWQSAETAPAGQFSAFAFGAKSMRWVLVPGLDATTPSHPAQAINPTCLSYVAGARIAASCDATPLSAGVYTVAKRDPLRVYLYAPDAANVCAVRLAAADQVVAGWNAAGFNITAAARAALARDVAASCAEPR